MKSWGLAVAIIIAAAQLSAAKAATFFYDARIDLGSALPMADGIEIPLPGGDFNFAPGDTLVGTVRFADRGRLVVSDDAAADGLGPLEIFLAPFIATDNLHTAIPVPTTWNFVGLKGDYLGPASFGTGLAGGAVGPYSAFDFTATSFSFTGFDFTVRYTAGDARVFRPFFIDIASAAVEIVRDPLPPGPDPVPPDPVPPVPMPVPEPATWAMMIGGSGSVGVALRRRRSARA